MDGQNLVIVEGQFTYTKQTFYLYLWKGQLHTVVL